MNKSKKKWLYLPLETKTRDLYGRVLLSCVAAENGFYSVLMHKADLKRYLPYMPRGTCVYFGVVGNYFKEISFIKKLGHTPVAWDEEGLVIFNEKEYLRCRVSLETLNMCAKFFAWGTLQACLIDAAFYKPYKVSSTGHPRFDLLRPEWRGVFSSEVLSIQKKYGPYILINTRFGVCNHYNGVEFGMQALRAKGYIADDLSKEFYSQKIEYEKHLLEAFIRVLPKIRKSFPQHAIVVRPHPSENHQIWKNALAVLKNTYVVHEGNVAAWILAADASIHNGCTTGVEAYVLDRPSVAYRPFISQELDISLPNTLSREVFSEEELLEALRAALQEKSFRLADNKEESCKTLIKKHLDGCNGKMASEKIVEELNGLHISSNLAGYDFRNTLALGINNAVISFKTLSRRLRNPQLRSYKEHKFPGLAFNEIREIIERLKQVSGRFKYVRIKKIGKDCYGILQ